MNWYKITKLATARTLYHGTSINNYNSIKGVGLVPDVGNFVSDSYGNDYKEMSGEDFDPTPLVYAADKEEVSKAFNAMTYAVSKMLGKTYHDVTNEQIRAYGMLVIIKDGENSFERRPVEETGPYRDWQGETDNQYPAVEPGDYYSEGGVGQKEIKILIGNKMVEFFEKLGLWDFSEDEIKNRLLTLSIQYHIKQQPELKDKIVLQIKEKVKNLSKEEVKNYYKMYQDKNREDTLNSVSSV